MRVLTLLGAAVLLAVPLPALSQEEPVEGPDPVEGPEPEGVAAEEDDEGGVVEPARPEDDEGGVVQGEDVPSLIEQCRREAESRAAMVVPPARKYPFLEWHGYFRMRSGLYTDVDLETFAPVPPAGYVGTSMFLPPLLHNNVNSSGEAAFNDKLDGETEQTVGTANMRLRLSPVIRASEALRIGATVDLLDNVVLGSTPEYMNAYARPAVALDTLTMTQVPPVAGLNGVEDSLVVKEAWAEWVIALDQDLQPGALTLGTVKAGRYAWHWGLGLLSNGGDYLRDDTSLMPLERFRALDAEGANYYDRASWRYDFGGFSILAGYGMLANGPTSRVAYDDSGQPYDLEDKDDVQQLELAVYSRPETRGEFLARRKQIFSGAPVLDWGLYCALRRQEMAITLEGVADPVVADYVGAYPNLELVDRSAWLAMPDLWLKLDWRPDPQTRFYAGLEWAFIVGRLGNATGTVDGPELDVLQYGGALETNYTTGLVSFGLDWGLASGDTGEMMGVYDGNEKAMLREAPWGADDRYTAFSFNPNYFVDMLLYRRVVGTVTNTSYFKPHFDFDIIPTEEDAFGGAISALYAITMEPEAWAGDSRNLGLEFDFLFYYEEADRFLSTLGFGMMFPFAALDRPADFLDTEVAARESVWAWTLQGTLHVVF